jgi:hypothetical protein
MTAGYLSAVSYAVLTFSKSCASSTLALASAMAAVIAAVISAGRATAFRLEIREEGFDLLEVFLALRHERLDFAGVRGDGGLGHGDGGGWRDLAGPDVDSLGDDVVHLAVDGVHVLGVLLLDLGDHGHAVRLDEVLDLGDGALSYYVG